jgi:uncharacterized membrane protein
MKKEKRRLFQSTAAGWMVAPAAFIFYALATIWTITKSSIWFDEAYSAYIIRFNYGEIAHYTGIDVHPPLYYWTLKTWQYVFGSSEFALRSMSLLFGLVALLFGFLLVKRWFGRHAALVSLWLLALSPMMIRYGQEARMYTMATAIVLGATYVLVVALDSKKRTAWLLYAGLIAAGMLTHYFTAFAWIAHWFWRIATTYKPRIGIVGWVRAVCGGYWLVSYLLAVLIFLPWLPYMSAQLLGIQSSGFWIGPVGLMTPINYLTNFLFYEEHGRLYGWLAAGLVFILLASIVFTAKSYAAMSRIQKKRYLLIIMLAVIPVMGLFLVSLPPLRPSFVERYLLFAYASLSMTMGVALTMAKVPVAYRAVFSVVLVTSFFIGIGNVYHFGNLNKNTADEIGTRRLIEAVVKKSGPGEPIIVSSAGLFYEAAFYATPSHPVFFIDEKVERYYGSEQMMKDHDEFKIKNINEFTSKHPTIWYIGTLDVPYASWEKKQTVVLHGNINPDQRFVGTEYETHQAGV